MPVRMRSSSAIDLDRIRSADVDHSPFLLSLISDERVSEIAVSLRADEVAVAIVVSVLGCHRTLVQWGCYHVDCG